MKKHKRVLAIIPVLIILVLGVSQITRAAVTYVVNIPSDVLNGGCTTDDCSLREAIIAANGSPGFDTILLPPGIYALTRRGTGEDAANSGDLDITDNINIVGSGSALTIIDGTFPGNGGGYDRVFDVGPNNVTISVSISGMTIQNANVTSYNGSGINNGLNANLTLERVHITNNRSSLSGGGIYNLGSLTLGISTIDHNTANVSGSAIYNGTNASMSISAITINNNAFTGSGAGVIDNWGVMTLTNSTVSGNSAPIWGGVVSRGTFTATNATIVNNSSGIYNISGGTFNLRNSIVALNASNNCVGTIASLDYNLIEQVSCSFTGSTTHNLIGVNPNLDALADNGGPTYTHALQIGSPAIDAGDPANCPSPDQRGAVRSFCDIGAFEAVSAPELFPPTVLNVTSTARTIDEGGSYSDDITQLLVNFNENIQDLPGDTDPSDVTNPSNYLLVAAGANGSIQTSVCGTLQDDDAAIIINSVGYNDTTYQATLNLEAAPALGNAVYRLVVCAAGLQDTDGNLLDGNMDRIAGDVFVRNFKLQSVLETPQSSPFTVNTTADGSDGMCSTTNCTLRDAIIAANNNAGGGAVINIAAGTYILMRPGSEESYAETGDLDIRANMTINGAGRDITIIDGNALDRIFQVLNNAVVTISDVTVRNGQTQLGYTSTDWDGGGISVASGSLTLTHSIVRDNHASNLPFGTSGSGGGINVEGNTALITIIDSQILMNTAYGAGGMDVDNGGKATITGSLIQGNQGSIGGIYVGLNSQAQTSVEIANSTVAGNTATGLGGGGGIYKNNSSSLIVQYTTITQNTANRGGGIYCTDSANITNSIIAGNNAAPNSNTTDIGGCSSVNRINNIFAPEVAMLGPLQDNGGATPTYALLPASPAIGRATGTCPANDQRGQMRDDGGCDIGAFETQSPPMVLNANLINTNPARAQIVFTESMQDPMGVSNPANYRLFTDGADNIVQSNSCGAAGGDDGTITINGVSYDAVSRTATVNLNASIPLPIDHYHLLVCASLTDLSGNALDGNRDGTQGDTYAQELYVDSTQTGSLLNVTVTDDTNDGLCGMLHCSLREAVIRANGYVGGGATISIPPGTYTLAIYGFEDAAASGDLDIDQSVTIYGAGANRTILDGGQIDRVFHFRNGTVMLAGVTVQNGMPPNSSNGGGIEIDKGPITILNSAIVNNTAGDSGGGIAIYGGTTVNLINSTISGNQSNGSDNPALYGRGGGIFNWGYLTVTNSTISGNSTNKWGGGILNFGSTHLNNVTITNNTADSDNTGDSSGGGIYNPSGTNLVGSFHLQNSIITGNVDRSGQSPDCGGNAPITSHDYNLIGNTVGCSTLGGTTEHNILNQDAKLVPLSPNGGPTATHGLQMDSPAINAGDPPTCTRADQRGILRSACDIGAFEVLSMPYNVVPPVVLDFQLLGAQPAIKQFQITFSEAVQDQPGNSDPRDVTNPGNYQIVGGGVDDTFQTTTCGSPSGNDIQIAIDSVTYTAPLYMAVLNVNGGTSLPPGWYRSIVCGGSGAILDLDGNALDGNGDYTAGDNFIQDFLVDTPQTGSSITVNTADDINNGLCGLIQCSLREAVIAGNNYSGVGEPIINVPAAEYLLTSEGVGENYALSGDLDIRKTLTIQGQGAATTIIDANGIDRVLHIVDGIVTVKDVTIQGGLPETNANGGGVLNEKNLNILNSVVQNNQTDGGNGGGIYSTYGLSLDHSIVSNNQAVDGGGIGNTLYVTTLDSTIRDNHASGAGGAINSSSGNVSLTRTTLRNNSASIGGALVNAGTGTGDLRNTTISGNLALTDGGGIVNQGASGLLLNNVTIANNTADSDSNGSGSGGGIFNSVANNNLRFSNTLIATNIDQGGESPDCGGEALYSQDYNLIGNLTGCGILGSTTHSFASVDAKITVLGNYGGSTFTHALMPDSPAIDSGDAISCEAIDQRGIARTQAFTCDIGAYERDLSPLESPTGLTATALSSSEIQLAWVDNASSESGYIIERITNTSSWSEVGTLGADVTVFADDDLQCDTYYYYRIRAVRTFDGQYSPYSPGAYAKTGLCAPPASPTNLTVTLRLEAQVELSWLNPTGENTLATRIERSDNGTIGWSEVGVALGNPTPPNLPPAPESTPSPDVPPAPTTTPGPTVTPTTPPPPVGSTSSFTDAPGCNKVVYYRIRHYRPGDGQLSDYTSPVSISIPPCYPQNPPMFVVNVTADANDGVCTVTHCALREAVIAANNTVNATITLSAGTYALSLSGQNEDFALTGDLDIRKNMTINGAGRDATIIDGGAIDRIFHIKNSSGIVNFTLNNLTAQNGLVNDVGGGLYTSVNGITTLNNVVFSGNQATRGGAIFNLPSRLNINDSLFVGNRTIGSDSGGALFNYRSNSSNGGGVFIVRSTFRDNAAGQGGAIASDGLGYNGAHSTIRIDDSTISGNRATSNGGGFALNASSDADVRNSTISGNIAGNYGGAFATIGSGSDVQLLNSTVLHNQAQHGGAVYYSGNLPVLANTIFAYNSGGNCASSGISWVYAGGHNIADDMTCNLNHNAVSNPGNLEGVDPLVAALSDNGGSTQTHMLLPSSPAIDHVQPANCILAADQRGVTRPQGSTCDVGAVEVVGGIIAAPSGLVASDAGSGSASLVWTDNSNDETGFRIERAPMEMGDWHEVGSVDVNITSFTDTDLVCGKTYRYRAQAYHNAPYQVSDYSAVASFTTATCPQADLSIGISDVPDPVTVNSPITYTLAITNDGPDTATGVVVTDQLPSSAGVNTVTPSQGTCNSVVNHTLTCNIGDITTGNNATIVIVVSSPTVSTLANTATVSSATNDPVSENNDAFVTTIVIPIWRQITNLAVSASGLPQVATVGTNVAVTLNITSSGPDDANTIVVDGSLSALAEISSLVSSQGSCSSPIQGNWSCQLGSLSANGNASINMLIHFAESGAYTFTSQVASDSVDASGDNNQVIQIGVVNSPSAVNAAPPINFYPDSIVEVSWNAVTWATGYEVWIDDNDDFSSPLFESGVLSNSTHSVMINLPGGVYYWQVRAINGNTLGNWSLRQQVTIPEAN